MRDLAVNNDLHQKKEARSMTFLLPCKEVNFMEIFAFLNLTFSAKTKSTLLTIK